MILSRDSGETLPCRNEAGPPPSTALWSILEDNEQGKMEDGGSPAMLGLGSAIVPYPAWPGASI